MSSLVTYPLLPSITSKPTTERHSGISGLIQDHSKPVHERGFEQHIPVFEKSDRRRLPEDGGERLASVVASNVLNRQFRAE